MQNIFGGLIIELYHEEIAKFRDQSHNGFQQRGIILMAKF